MVENVRKRLELAKQLGSSTNRFKMIALRDWYNVWVFYGPGVMPEPMIGEERVELELHDVGCTTAVQVFSLQEGER